jgi:hypothetical protein
VDESDYDAVPYDDRPVAETHPDRLYVAARARGVRAVRPERARILELGCAHAVNLLPIAAACPDARVLGVDLSAKQIERARRDIAASGIENLEVRCADVATLDVGDERFDYVIAHGLFSWVPDDVRDRVLALGREVLAEHGVMYVSFNAMPAWGLRGGVRKALRDLVDLGARPRARIGQAREAIAWLTAHAPGEGTAEHALLVQELDALAGASDAYLLHEYLVPSARSYWLREVVALAQAHELAWIDDVAPTGLTPGEQRALVDAIADRVEDPIARAQMFDVLAHRQFRATLLGRRETPRTVPDADTLLDDLHVAANGDETADGDDAMVAELRACWPRDRPARGGGAALVRAWEDGRVELRARALPIADNVDAEPCVAAITRAEAARLPFVTTPSHRATPLDPLHARLVTLLDGTRSAAGLADALAEDLRVGRLTADAPVSSITPMLPRFVAAALERLCAAGLLVHTAAHRETTPL